MKIGISCRYDIKKKKYRSIIHSEEILDLFRLNTPDSTKPNIGNGSYDNPYQPTTIAHWYYLSQLDLEVKPMYVLVGGRLIARWGTGAKNLKRYCTDVTGFENVDSSTSIPDYEDFIHLLGREYELMDSKNKIDTKLPSYTKKALRVYHLDDRAAAIISRNILQGLSDCGQFTELPSSLCALLLCEGARVPETFTITMMLLDLIETNTTYGKGGLKMYTWKSMLMYGVNGTYIPGRGNGIKSLGKHPMTGQGTVDLGNKIHIFNTGLTNIVLDRIISITSVWLVHYMTKNSPKIFEFFIVADTGHKIWQNNRMGELGHGDQSLKANCRKAIKARSNNLNLLIGGTTVYYENIAGETI